MTELSNRPRPLDKTHPLYVAWQWDTYAALARQAMESVRENRRAYAVITARQIAADPDSKHDLQVAQWQLDQEVAPILNLSRLPPRP